jgi:DNA-binding NarL/FixJ family response regulator
MTSEIFKNAHGKALQLEASFIPLYDKKENLSGTLAIIFDSFSRLPINKVQQAYQSFYTKTTAHQQFIKHIFADHVDLFQSTTQKEFDCLLAMAKGRSVKQIACKLAASPRTIEKHVNNLKEKLNCSNHWEMTELFRQCIDRDVLH